MLLRTPGAFASLDEEGQCCIYRLMGCWLKKEITKPSLGRDRNPLWGGACDLLTSSLGNMSPWDKHRPGSRSGHELSWHILPSYAVSFQDIVVESHISLSVLLLDLQAHTFHSLPVSSGHPTDTSPATCKAHWHPD